jgi:DinB superfamily
MNSREVIALIKGIAFVLFGVLVSTVSAADKKPATLRKVLLSELKETHSQEEWFVPANIAVKGLTAQQASWMDGKGNHSVGQLAHHLVYWNRRNLAKLKGQQPEKFSGNNEETFDRFDVKQWNDTVRQLDEVMDELEKFVGSADEPQLKDAAQTLARISMHNAYHVGQIIYVRKEQGSWDPKNGVK